MSHSHSGLNMNLVIGIFAIGLGLTETCSGNALPGYGRSVSCDEDPKMFWQVVAIHYVGGVAALGYYLYQKFWTN